MTQDDFTEDNHGLAECARINLENAARFQPGLASNPMYQIAMDQLRLLCNQMADEE